MAWAHQSNTGRECGRHCCNAYLQRELTYVHEQMEQQSASDMIAVLLEARELADREKARPPGAKRLIGEKTVDRIMARYSRIVADGYEINSEPPEPPPDKSGRKKKGRKKRSKALNLLNRLDSRPREIMEFFGLPKAGIPYDNNQAKRALKVMKVLEKISRTVRSEDYRKHFVELHGISQASANRAGRCSKA